MQTNQVDVYQAAFPSELGKAGADRSIVTESMEGLGAVIVLVWESCGCHHTMLCLSVLRTPLSHPSKTENWPINCDSSLGHTKGLVPWGLETLACYPFL